MTKFKSENMKEYGTSGMEHKIQTQRARDGSTVFIYENSYKTTALNSVYSPEKEINRFFKELKDKSKEFIVVIGVGNGSLINKLVRSSFFENNIHYLNK